MEFEDYKGTYLAQLPYHIRDDYLEVCSPMLYEEVIY